MAEIAQQKTEGSSGKVRLVKRSTRIDMTPMVDLAFLLLTFFILTTTFNKAHVLELPMPDNDEPKPVSADKILNVVLANDNKIFWWDGLEGNVSATNYSNTGLRKLLLDKQRSIPKLMVLIKPQDNSRYENMVDVLDEISITGTQRYAIVKYSNKDREHLSQLP